MIIRKTFRFENAHIVRGCSTERCKRSIHGHSYEVEILLESDVLDNGQMVYDFGLMKGAIHDIVDSFDHAIAVWDRDEPEYIAFCKRFSARCAVLPVSPSAEQFSRVIFVLVRGVLRLTQFKNGEGDVRLHSVIVHETKSAYAQCFEKDADSERMGLIDPLKIEFSDAIRAEWKNAMLVEQVLKGVC